MADAIKLLTKEVTKLRYPKILIIWAGPALALGLMLVMWLWFPHFFPSSPRRIKLLLIFATIRLTIYRTIFIRWGSNSKYAIIGGHRRVAQVLSYEVCFFILALTLFYSLINFNIRKLELLQQNIWVGVFSAPILITWLLLCLCESNRAPFDLSEGESEIVSGFNIEYGGGMFALIFIAEYGIIIFLSSITALLFLGGSRILLKALILSFVFIWLRCRFPRVRYDLLINIAWKLTLPYTLAIILLIMML